MHIAEIEMAVSNIMNDIYESTDGVEYFDLTLSTNGCCQLVEFCGIRLWSSEDDDRRYASDDDESEENREGIEDYLRRVLEDEICKLCSIVV